MTDSFSVASLAPADMPEYMLGAWVGLVHWALGKDEIVAQFRAETGNQWEPATDPLSSMVDSATGADRDFITQFAQWINTNYWGVSPGIPTERT